MPAIYVASKNAWIELHDDALLGYIQIGYIAIFSLRIIA